MSETAHVDQEPTWWTLSEVSAYFREDSRTTRRRIQRGELKPVILPGSRKLLFRSSEVVSYVDAAAGAMT